jgi:hypothetical protein
MSISELERGNGVGSWIRMRLKCMKSPTIDGRFAKRVQAFGKACYNALRGGEERKIR